MNIKDGDRNDPEKIDRFITTWKAFFASITPNFTSQLFGTCVTWFLLDIAFYSQSL